MKRSRRLRGRERNITPHVCWINVPTGPIRYNRRDNLTALAQNSLASRNTYSCPPPPLASTHFPHNMDRIKEVRPTHPLHTATHCDRD